MAPKKESCSFRGLSGKERTHPCMPCMKGSVSSPVAVHAEVYIYNGVISLYIYINMHGFGYRIEVRIYERQRLYTDAG